MKTSFLSGLLLSFLLFILGYMTKLDIFILISGGIGLGFLLISGILSGAFVNGDKYRANYATETSSNK